MPPAVILGGSPARGADGVVLVHARHGVGSPPTAGGFEFDDVPEAGAAGFGGFHAFMVPVGSGAGKALAGASLSSTAGL